MVLLALVAVGLLSLSTITLRGESTLSAQAEARSNARLALMLAIGALQKEMGPDMRISAQAALFDEEPETEAIDGVDQPYWMASYNSWGDWLNAEYTLPDGGESLSIADTYEPQRSKMFRRWLVSLPENMGDDPKDAVSPAGWDDSESIVMVGEGSVGDVASSGGPRETRAFAVPVGETGRQAWWISPENQKARIDLASQPRTLGDDEWETSQGNTAEVGVGVLDGMADLDAEAFPPEKLVSVNTLRPAGITEDQVKSRFHDLTANSRGVLASVRTGQLKKDLSLLFEKPDNQLPSSYRFSPNDIQEPSIRPMSQDLASKNPKIPNRHFASWTNMRHFYRMYRTSSDASPTEQGVAGSLKWTKGAPSTDYATSTSMQKTNPRWDGSNHYWRAPVLAKLTLVYSLVAKQSPTERGKYQCLEYYSPVFTFWNPYNTQMVIPSGQMTISSKAYRMWPTNMAFHLNGQFKTKNNYGEGKNFIGKLSSGGSGDIVFGPGELKVFSMKASIDSRTGGGQVTELVPGFDPSVVAGDERTWRVGASKTFSPGEKPGVAYEFSCAQWGGGVNVGNTPGAMFIESSLAGGSGKLPMTYSNDWFQRAPHQSDQTSTPITPPGASNLATWEFDGNPKIVAYAQMAIKGLFEFDYPSIDWARDWRSRNWIQAPPFYFGSGMYMSLDDTIAHTQRLDCPYIVNFGPTTTFGISKIVGQIGDKAFLGSGAPAYEQVTSAAVLELPTAPIGSLAGFANMRINPGWVKPSQYLKRDMSASDPLQLKARQFSGNGSSVAKCSLYSSESKRVAYQSGVTGPGIGNSFMHPMLPRDDVYRFINNSVSRDVIDRTNPNVTEEVDTQAYCDYWDHVFLLNDALWDDYFVSSLADQSRPGAGGALSLEGNLDLLIEGDPEEKTIANSRYRFHPGDKEPAEIKAELRAQDGYLKAAGHLMVDGMFNVNSSSVDAWHALFAGIRERKAVYRNSSGRLGEIDVPDDHIAITRFNTEVSDKEMDDAGRGVTMPDGSSGWSGVRFLSDEQLRKLAEECVKQVKQRGPFLSFSEFINRRLSDDEDDLGVMGALQSAIDYDDKAPDSSSINYRYKSSSAFMLKASDLGKNSFNTPEAAEGSRLAGIPGYVIQSDLLKPIANTLSVRDDTFRIRAYGEAKDANGTVLARAWCEATVQRLPEYVDPVNDASVPARLVSVDGAFSDNGALSDKNRRFGRKFVIESFRWLHSDEV